MLSSGSSFLSLYEMLLLKTEMLGFHSKGTQRSACNSDAIKFEFKFVPAKAHCHMSLSVYLSSFLPTGRALYMDQCWTKSLEISHNWSAHLHTTIEATKVLWAISKEASVFFFPSINQHKQKIKVPNCNFHVILVVPSVLTVVCTFHLKTQI